MGNTSDGEKTPTPVIETVVERVIHPGEKLFQNAMAAMSRRDHIEALKLFLESDQNGFVNAGLELGKMYRDGTGCDQSLENALLYLKKVQLSGNPAAEAELGLIYYHGLVCEPVDHGTALFHFRNGMELGDMDCRAHFGWMTIQGQGVPQKDYKKGLDLIKEAEDQSLWALNYLGFINLEGVDEHCIDYPAALTYFSRAAEKGHLEAKVNLAYMYLQGKGMKAQTWEAAKLFTVTAERGHSIAQVHLGMMYRDGVGVKPNLKVAKSWFEKAAKQKDALGSYALGKMMLDNKGSDWLDIVDLFQHAAQQGNVRGIMYDSIYIDTLARIFDGYEK